MVGYFCLEGASAALPCPGGTAKPAATLGAMTSAAQCVTCPVGTFCPVGSEAATNCSAGTYNAQQRQETCTKCAPGTYQDAEGMTACDACTDGYFCPAGASAALPCPGGTTRKVGVTMTSEADCDVCGEGTAAAHRISCSCASLAARPH